MSLFTTHPNVGGARVVESVIECAIGRAVPLSVEMEDCQTKERGFVGTYLRRTHRLPLELLTLAVLMLALAC